MRLRKKKEQTKGEVRDEILRLARELEAAKRKLVLLDGQPENTKAFGATLK